MSDRSFVDTNVLVYTHDVDEPRKRERARTVLAGLPADAMVISSQVLGEFYWATTRRLRTPLTHETADAAVAALAKLEVVVIDAVLVRRAITRSVTAQLAYWDALIVEAALGARCTRLLTEDLGAGTRFGELEVVNPFA